MSDIQVGDFVRDRDGIIIKVNNIVLDEDSEDIWYEEKLLQGTWKSMIIKNSPNLIDLVECGDYVNGSLVYNQEGKLAIELCEYMPPFQYIENMTIEDIVTHEQFNSVMYKVKE